MMSFKIGELYTIQDIQQALSVGNAGGIRAFIGPDAVVRRLVVLTAVPSARQASENPYHDRIEGDVLFYTGAGREGDQTLAGVNKRIPQQFERSFPIYGFILVGSRRDKETGPRRWRFLGLLEYLRHYPDSQADSRGAVRSVWAFEFRILRSVDAVEVSDDYHLSDAAISESRRRLGETGDEAEIQPPATPGDAAAKADEVERMRGRLLAVVPERFEHLIRDLLVATGFERVAVTKYSQDGGIDVNAYAGPSMWPVKDLLIQVQAKRWLHSVGRREVAELRGSLHPHAKGAIVTTSHYSRAAIAEATDSHKSPIVLVDGYALATLFIANHVPLG